MVITELDRRWARAVRTKAIRAGKLRRQTCAMCRKRANFVESIDHNDPSRVRWLCKRHKNEVGLSQLQRSLIRDGLLAYYRGPLDLACSRSDPGCFQIRFRLKGFADSRIRASRRAAAGLAIARLIRRGLLERCERAGRWRLTRAGKKVAQRLWPEIRCPTKRQLASDIALVRAMSALAR